MSECPETGSLVVVQDEIRGARIGFVSNSKDNEIEITFEDSTNDSRWTPSLFSGDKEWFGERSPKICRESTHILIKVSQLHDNEVLYFLYFFVEEFHAAAHALPIIPSTI